MSRALTEQNPYTQVKSNSSLVFDDLSSDHDTPQLPSLETCIDDNDYHFSNEDLDTDRDMIVSPPLSTSSLALYDGLTFNKPESPKHKSATPIANKILFAVLWLS